MESILNIIVNAENGRMLILMAFAYVGYTRLRYDVNKRIDEVNCRIDGLKYDVNKRIDGVEASIKDESTAMNKRIDGVEASIKELKYDDLAAIHRRIDDLKNNDFAHLKSTIEALTYALEKNGSLKREDKEYVDSRLAH